MTVLITGGTGSFGQAFTQHVLTHNLFEKIIIFSRDEWKQSEMQKRFSSDKIRYFIGNVRDKERLQTALQDVDVVIHASALKQVPTCEYNPHEAVKTNVLGAMNVIEASIACGVEKVIALSTDKAVSPANLYGATKLCQDKLFIAANHHIGKALKPLFSVVRYGNVSHSRGSVLPLWQELIKQGHHTLPLTDPRMTRFWMTLTHAVTFVLESVEIMQGAELFIPKLPSYSIKDLATALAPECHLEHIGVRPGEKLEESLLNSDEARTTLEFCDHYRLYPQTSFREQTLNYERAKAQNLGKPLPEGFCYSSSQNRDFLSIEDLRVRLQQLHTNPLMLNTF